MSRLSSHRANAPALNKKSKFIKFKKPGWRKGEPMLVGHPCRAALNEAIAVQDFGKADRIAATKRRRIYASLSKPQLLDYLRKV